MTKSSVETFYHDSDISGQVIAKLDFLPVASSGFVNADQFVGEPQADLGFVIILDNAVVDAAFLVSEIDFVVVADRLPGGFLDVFLTDVFTFHTLIPLSERCSGLIKPDNSYTVRFYKTYRTILAQI